MKFIFKKESSGTSRDETHRLSQNILDGVESQLTAAEGTLQAQLGTGPEDNSRSRGQCSGFGGFRHGRDEADMAALEQMGGTILDRVEAGLRTLASHSRRLRVPKVQ